MTKGKASALAPSIFRNIFVLIRQTCEVLLKIPEGNMGKNRQLIFGKIEMPGLHDRWTIQWFFNINLWVGVFYLYIYFDSNVFWLVLRLEKRVRAHQKNEYTIKTKLNWAWENWSLYFDWVQGCTVHDPNQGASKKIICQPWMFCLQ